MTERLGGRKIWLAALLAAGFYATCVMGGETPGGWRVGVGTSLAKDAGEAGEAAAAEARKQYGDGDVKLVLVFAVRPQVTPELVASVARHFPRELIYGGEAVAPLTPETNLPDAKNLDSEEGVGILAIGGDVTLTIATDTVGDDAGETEADDDDDVTFASYLESGRRLGGALAPAMKNCALPGKLILTHGDQYNGSNSAFAKGMQDALGGPMPLVGGAAWNQTGKEIVAGEIRQRMNFAVLFCGDFRVGQSLMGGTHTPEVAGKVLDAASEAGDGEKPFFGFVFNCRRRRTGMIERGQLAEELSVIQRHFAGIPFFGAYGPGEIGVRNPGEAAVGTGFSVSAALLFPVKAPGK